MLWNKATKHTQRETHNLVEYCKGLTESHAVRVHVCVIVAASLLCVCLCGLHCNVAVRGAELRPGVATAPEPPLDDHGLQENTPLFSPPRLDPPRNHCLSWQQNYVVLKKTKQNKTKKKKKHVWICTQQDGLVYFSLMMSHYFGHGFSDSQTKTWNCCLKGIFLIARCPSRSAETENAFLLSAQSGV